MSAFEERGKLNRNNRAGCTKVVLSRIMARFSRFTTMVLVFISFLPIMSLFFWAGMGWDWNFFQAFLSKALISTGARALLSKLGFAELFLILFFGGIKWSLHREMRMGALRFRILWKRTSPTTCRRRRLLQINRSTLTGHRVLTRCFPY